MTMGASFTLQNTMTQVTNVNAKSFVWPSYVDVIEDVMPWLQFPPEDEQALTTSDMMKLELLTDMTCQWVQRKLGQPIAPTSFYARVDGWTGWNGAYVMLPYYPVLEILEVNEWWGISGPHPLAEQTPTHDIDGFNLEYTTGRLTRVFPGLVQKPWFPGTRNIEIAWIAGWNPMPADWKVATLEMIAHWWRNTQQTQRTNIRGGPGDQAEAVANGLWEGTPLAIANLLDSAHQFAMG